MTLETGPASQLARSLESVFSSIYDPATTTTTSKPNDPTTTAKGTTTSETSSTKTIDWTQYEPSVTVTCQQFTECLGGANAYAQCDQSKDLIVDTDLYTTYVLEFLLTFFGHANTGTCSGVKGGNGGECYYDGKSKIKGTACMLGVQGYKIKCEIAGLSMKAYVIRIPSFFIQQLVANVGTSAYDAIRKKCGTKCGIAAFGDKGCQVAPMVVGDASCGTKSVGGIDMNSLT
jgi:hypothetical protein